MSYEQFKLALYCTAGDLEKVSREQLEEDFQFFRKHLNLSKVYVESHRGATSLEPQRLRELKAYFEGIGLETAGGITPTLPGSYRSKSPRLFGVICYTDESSRAKFKQEVEKAASVFDEIIFDDFFFTNCGCSQCLAAKGDRSWAEFRLELMTEVSENLIVKPAKAVNPNVKLVIKYPNWAESYAHNGYNTRTQPQLFDGTYAGTETRDNAVTQQNLPRYASYSLLRWFDQLKPGVNGGGWFDNLDCTVIDDYLAQANLTVFAKAKELTLFCYGTLKHSVYVPALGFQLERLDRTIGFAGRPVGIPVYLPHHAEGEDHLQDTFGMLGIPLEPMPRFPEEGGMVLLTAAAGEDGEILEKMRRHMLSGGDVCITSGFLKRMEGKGIEAFTTLRSTGANLTCQSFGIETWSCAFAETADGSRGVSLPVFDYRTNGTWQLIVGWHEDTNIPVLMYDMYGKGKLYTWVLSEHAPDLAYLPDAVLTRIRHVLSGAMPVPVVLEGASGACLFVYDNDTFIIESFRSRRTSWNIRVPSGGTLALPLGNTALTPAFRAGDGSSIYEISLQPSEYKLLKLER